MVLCSEVNGNNGGALTLGFFYSKNLNLPPPSSTGE